MYKVPVGLAKLLVILTDKSADGVIGVLGIQLAVLSNFGDIAHAVVLILEMIREGVAAVLLVTVVDSSGNVGRMVAKLQISDLLLGDFIVRYRNGLATISTEAVKFKKCVRTKFDTIK